ncbi:MAG: metal-dependent transcriptional regulator [Candidatus Margulisbacteria bacterium]|nr:metal-dependent transcriptional regulator [Candidatus Margulisiibacteriota bacterium]
MILKTKEDYLEIIFHLESEGKKAATNEIASHLKISSASVSEHLRKLAKEGLISYQPYKEIALTAKGKKIAVDVVRRHRLTERFLTDKLGIKWEEAHGEAHKLEHDISKVVGDKMYKMLGEPETCPHGNPVPDANGRIKEEPSQPLVDFDKDDKLRIVKITDEEPKLLCYLATLGLMPKTQIKVEQVAPFNGPIMVKVGSAVYALGRKIAEAIWVRKV